VLGTIKAIHTTADNILEERVCTVVKEHLPIDQIEFRVDNFKRISRQFAAKPQCGEIDILCINKETKTVFVIEVKNVTKRASNYNVKMNIKRFFLSGDSYYSKLMKKKTFVLDNLSEVLAHFSVTDTNGWIVKEVFVTSDLQFAAFYNHQRADFILVNEVGDFLKADYNLK
jgi:hypothetical protein